VGGPFVGGALPCLEVLSRTPRDRTSGVGVGVGEGSRTGCCLNSFQGSILEWGTCPLLEPQVAAGARSQCLALMARVCGEVAIIQHLSFTGQTLGRDLGMTNGWTLPLVVPLLGFLWT
jgi:hypothetical protein